MYVPQADGCAFVWPPAVAADASDDAAEAIADALLQDVASRLDRSGVWLGQCLLDPADALNAARLGRNGFGVLAELDYLNRSLREPLPELTTPALAVNRADPIADAARLAAIIEQTYVESADCPAVSGWRTGMDAVRGHRHTGVLLPEGWMIFRDTSGGDAGVLILADQPEQNAWELVYMGVAPVARGRGYGREIVIAALREAARSQREAVVLAVDAGNDYARTVYERLGFRFLESRARACAAQARRRPHVLNGAARRTRREIRKKPVKNRLFQGGGKFLRITFDTPFPIDTI